mmetsp:Transcript_11734/g.16826  ORF Transcript_11734/g.16826 Transcript_11734/m.16826 type:complete len:214 (-) Transcript_11734:1958-2599(-)
MALQTGMRLLILSLIIIILSFVSVALGRADNIINLTDKTFDNVKDAFGHRPMLILAQGGGHRRSNDATESFGELSDDQILRENGIMLVTIDAKNNRMLRARLGINTSDLPSLLYLYNNHLYRYQGDLSSSSHMRSYALKGYENNIPEKLMSASLWLYLNTIYLDFLYYNNADRLNLCALLLLSVVVGMIAMFAFAVTVVSISSEEGDEKKKTL